MVQQVKIWRCLCGSVGLILGLASLVKDPALLQLWHRPQLWLGFDPWPGNFHTLQVWSKKKKKKIEILCTYAKFKSFQECTVEISLSPLCQLHRTPSVDQCLASISDSSFTYVLETISCYYI